MKGSNKYTTVDNQVYDVPPNQYVTDIPRSKQAKKDRLQTLIFHLLQKRWSELPKQRVTLEKIALKELISAL